MSELTSSKTYQTLWNTETYNTCQGDINYYPSEIVAEEHVELNNSIQRRVLPDLPIWDAGMQTALARQYTHDKKVTLARHVTYPKYFCDGVWRQGKTVYNKSFMITPQFEHWHPLYPGTGYWGTKLRLAIAEEQVNLGSYLAEMRESASLFSSTASALLDVGKTLLNLRKGRIRFSKRKLRKLYWREHLGASSPKRDGRLNIDDLAATELLSSFALNPMLLDLHHGMQLLDAAKSRPMIRKIVVHDREESSGLDPSNPNNVQMKWLSKVRAEAYVRYYPDMTPFTAGNILSVIHEGIPFSFVLDWMFTIGDTLQAMDALSEVQFMTGTWNEKEIIVQHCPVFGDPEYYETFQEGQVITKVNERHTISKSSVPLPLVPQYRPSSSLKAVRHGLSLLWLLRKS